MMSSEASVPTCWIVAAPLGASMMTLARQYNLLVQEVRA